MYPRQIDQINNSALEALSFSEALIAKAVPLGINALGALAILLIGLFLAAAIRRGTRNAFNRTSRIDETVASFLSSLIYYGVVAMVLYAVLTRFGIPTTSLAAMLGAAGPRHCIGLARHPWQCCFGGDADDFSALSAWRLCASRWR